MIKNLWIILLLTLLSVMCSFIFCFSNTFAYRPFVSTDAAVAEKGELEPELGLFGISHDERIDEITVPSLILNYGILKNWEIVGELDVQVYKQGEDRDFKVKDPALFLKGILREGIFQEQEGPSFAVEFGVLLPSTVRGERRTGFEWIGILSDGIFNFAYHLNLGMELDRENLDLNGIWGIILEYPFEGKLRLVGEVNGVVKHHSLPENSGLVGFIWEIEGVDFDFGIRKGLSDAASDWEATTGITFSF